MSFDQRPARATRRIIPSSKPQEPLSGNLQASAAPKAKPVEAPAKSKIGSIFVVSAIVGGALSTAAIYGLIPGLPPIPLQAFAN